mmetsp:Transcript_27554/g.68499  ORF Transcript_27554/g.68499 Transcript_27554/m.68499 type:complete len:226 (+) Transcript_27554:1408-2085(+)
MMPRKRLRRMNWPTSNATMKKMVEIHPLFGYASCHRSFQFSPTKTTYMVASASPRESKFSGGASHVYTGEAARQASRGVLYAPVGTTTNASSGLSVVSSGSCVVFRQLPMLPANSSVPSSANMKMMSNSTAARSRVCVMEPPIVAIILRKPGKERASLKARSSRRARSDDKFMFALDPVTEMTISTMEMSTTSASKMLKKTLQYSVEPRATSLNIISNRKANVKT